MKKECLIAVLAIVAQGSWAANVEQMDSTNMVGMTRYSSKLQELPIGVVYGDYAITNQPICVSNLLWTGNLEQNDKLYVYDFKNSAYSVCRLEADKTWSSIEDDDAEELDVERSPILQGRGVWLVRNNISGRADTNVYIFGQVPFGDVTTAVLGGGKSTLIAFPRTEEFSLNNPEVVSWASTAVNGDLIRWYNQNDEIMEYKWNSSKGLWRYFNGEEWKSDCVIPRVGAFWYVRKAGAAATNIVWHLNAIGNH